MQFGKDMRNKTVYKYKRRTQKHTLGHNIIKTFKSFHPTFSPPCVCMCVCDDDGRTGGKGHYN